MPSDVARFENAMAEGRLADALEIAARIEKSYWDDAHSCEMAGEGGEASRAERNAEDWAKKIREVKKMDRFRGCLLGLATGDAVGTTLEFKPRGTFEPITDMVGGGPFGLEAGQWTDDTSMALCLATSLLHCNGFNAEDQMSRYCNWRDRGYLSSTGECFDIGNTIAAALDRYRRTKEPFAGSDDPSSAGNGSIMRLAPIPMFFLPRYLDIGIDSIGGIARYAGDSSRTTHAAAECLVACRFFANVVARALAGWNRKTVLSPQEPPDDATPRLASIIRGEYADKTEDEIKGSGYVVDSLEAALWCFATTETFGDAILRAANLGDDADTTAAVCGQVAGAFYGATGIPEPWLSKLAMRDEITEFADKLMAG